MKEANKGDYLLTVEWILAFKDITQPSSVVVMQVGLCGLCGIFMPTLMNCKCLGTPSDGMCIAFELRMLLL